jgi:SAM-dependent methyltransferase
MSTQPERYDAAYYRAGCGPVSYENRELWLLRFRGVAGFIAEQLKPRNAHDAGCAFGYLVEALRERGIDARGSDISGYAISMASPAARDFVRIGSVTDALPERVDLITCIEILEHVDAATGDTAIATFCAHTDTVLFSSSPDDHDEATHLNVQPPHYWAARFAQHGFYRDLSVDARIVATWAAVFRRQPTLRAEVLWLGYEDAHTAAAAKISALEHTYALQQIAAEKRDAQVHALERERTRLAALVYAYQNGRLMRLIAALHKLFGGAGNRG